MVRVGTGILTNMGLGLRVQGLGVPKLGVPIIRIIVFRALYWSTPL